MALDISKQDLDEMLDRQAKTIGGIVKNGAGGGGASSDSFLPDAAKKAGGAFTGIFDTVTSAGHGISNFAKSIENNLNVWRDLSAGGANFNNDIVAMSAAAAGTRMSLGDFQDVIKKNHEGMIGLGGSVNQSTQIYAHISKEMADSKNGYVDSLKEMGYSNKDINEVLALQVSFQRSTLANNKAAQEGAAESAFKLATEMDAMAKLTGKSRQAQMDELKKAEADSQVRAKFLLLEAEDRRNGTHKAEEARKLFDEQYNAAALRGQGQYFKEIFATGHVMSTEAANQQAIYGEQATYTAEQARATADGNAQAAAAANDKAEVAQLENLHNEGKLRMAILGEQGGVAAKENMKNIESADAKEQAIESIRKEAAWKDKSDAEIRNEAIKRIELEQRGKDKHGDDEKGAATTKAAILLGNRISDVNSALMNGLVKPINEGFYPAMQGVIVKLNNMTVGRKGGDTSYAKAVESDIANGVNTGLTGAGPKSEKELLANGVGGESKGGYMGSNLAASIGNITGSIAKATITGVEHLDIGGVPKYGDGASVSTPQLAVVGDGPGGKGSGLEHIIPDGAFQSMVSSIKKSASDESSGIMGQMTNMFNNMFSSGSTNSKSNTQTSEVVASKPATLDDVVKSLNELNKTMMSMEYHTEAISQSSSKQVKVTRGMSNDRFNLA